MAVVIGDRWLRKYSRAEISLDNERDFDKADTALSFFRHSTLADVFSGAADKKPTANAKFAQKLRIASTFVRYFPAQNLSRPSRRQTAVLS